MRPHLFGIALFGFLALPGLLRAQPKDIAELIPHEPILYLEVIQPELLAKDLTALFKGSTLENPLPFFGREGQKWKAGEFVDRSDAGVMATLFGSAMLKEAKKFEGFAYAITGFDAKGSTEFIAVFKPGESKLPHTLMRTYLTKPTSGKKVLTVEGIDIFQDNSLDLSLEPNLPLAPIEEVPTSPRMALAQTSGLLIVGSSKEQVAMVIRRWKEKEKSANFTSSAAFKDVVEGRKQPGLLANVNAKALTNWIEPQLQSGRPVNPTGWVALKELLPPALVKSLTAHVSLSEGTVRCSVQLNFLSGKAIPVLDFFDGQTIGAEQLQSLPAEGGLALTLAFPKGEQRLKKVLGVLDILIKASGTLGPTASEMLQEMEEKKQPPNLRQTLSKVSGCALLLSSISGPKGEIPLPSIVVHSEDAEAAQTLETLLPSILEMVAGEPFQPITETIEGQKIRSVAIRGGSLHYGRKDTRFAIGSDRKRIASVLVADKARSWPISPNETTSLTRNPMVVGLRWSDLLKNPTGKPVASNPRRKAPNEPVEGLIDDFPRRILRPSTEGSVGVTDQLQTLPPAWITVRRQENSVRLEWGQLPPKTGFTKLIDLGFEWYGANERGSPYFIR